MSNKLRHRRTIAGSTGRMGVAMQQAPQQTRARRRFTAWRTEIRNNPKFTSAHLHTSNKRFFPKNFPLTLIPESQRAYYAALKNLGPEKSRWTTLPVLPSVLSLIYVFTF